MKIQSNTQQGFTLIELMITVAIIGILSAIALPSYSEHVKKGKRTEAKVELLRIAQMQESYFVQNLSYAKDLTTGTGGLGLGTSVKSETDLYNISLSATKDDNTACTGLSGSACTKFTLTATPDSSESQAGDTLCTGFRIDNIARKFATGSGVTGYADSDKAKACW